MTQSTETEQQYQQLIDWLHRSAMGDWDVQSLQVELIEQLKNFGIELSRMHIGIPMLHPLFSVGTYTWVQGEVVEANNYPRGISKTPAWLESPARPIYERGENEGRFLLSPGGEFEAYPILREAAENGATDYFLQLTNFRDRSKPVDMQEGIVITWTTSVAGGFKEEELSLLRRLRLPLSAQLKNLTHRRLVDDILTAYLGSYSGQRVHAGQIQRGDGDMIDAVILFCDLRHSSSLAEQYDLSVFLEILNQYYEVTAGAVADHCGEVLRFIGDASLAIFPFERFGEETTACKAALDAAMDACRRGKALNAERASKGEPGIEFGIGLHSGTVLYGNIGTPSRLEFTVIGKAANEAARIESKCRELNEQILVSRAFADRLDVPWRSLGTFNLRNIGEPMEILSPTATLE